MTMEPIFAGMFIALIGIILIRLLSGRINTRGLLSSSRTGTIEPDRFQALITAIAVPLLYLSLVVESFRDSSGTAALPDVPDWMLITTAASQALYITGKVARKTTEK